MNIKNIFFFLTTIIILHANAAQVDVSRCDTIINAFDTTTNTFRPSFESMPTDSETMQECLNRLEQKIAYKQSILGKLYPALLAVGGGIFASAAGIGALISVTGSISSHFLLNQTPNMREQDSVTYKQARFGLSYPQFLQTLYFKAIPLMANSRLKTKEITSQFTTQETITSDFIDTLSPAGNTMMIFGAVAPIVAPLALVSAGIAKYLFNKVAGYKSEVSQLESQRELYKDIIAVLKK